MVSCMELKVKSWPRQRSTSKVLDPMALKAHARLPLPENTSMKGGALPPARGALRRAGRASPPPRGFSSLLLPLSAATGGGRRHMAALEACPSSDSLPLSRETGGGGILGPLRLEHPHTDERVTWRTKAPSPACKPLQFFNLIRQSESEGLILTVSPTSQLPNLMQPFAQCCNWQHHDHAQIEAHAAAAQVQGRRCQPGPAIGAMEPGGDAPAAASHGSMGPRC